jgi:alcohol dehydrogenase (cytochrome c)/quinohemoprotein ethanol dehydrogenase
MVKSFGSIHGGQGMRSTSQRRRVLLSTVLLGAVTVLTFGISHARDANAPASVDAARMKRADSDAANWLSYGRTYSEQRFSPLSKINAGNAKQLGLAWYADLDTDRGQEATPLVIDGVLYTSTAWSLVKAYDAGTGKLLWSYDPQVPKELGVEGCCDVVSRGIAAWKGRIYVATFDARLIALDARTGKPVWSTRVGEEKHITITQAPRVVKDRVIIGMSGGEYGIRGYISAFDAETGKRAWRFYTVPGDPSKPFENKAMEMAAKTWSGEWWKNGGGGGVVWDAISYDPELNLIYFGTGNGEAWSRSYRSNDKGDNLFLSSIVALNADTGAYVWHFQVMPGEEWDYDAVAQLTLAELKIDGTLRKVIMQANKNGFFYVLDRKTGQFISAKPFVHQNWGDVDQKTGRPIEHADIRYSTTGKPVVMMPGPDGGHTWHPMAYNPKTGLIYIPAQEIGKLFSPVTDFKVSEMGWNLYVDVAGTPEKKKGYLLAWDPVAQKEVWRSDYIGPWNGGIVTTAGNLVIQGDATGHLNAYRADNGQKLWSIDVQSPIMAAPVTYEANGEQYVAVLSGFGSAFSLQAGAVAGQSGNIRNISRVLAFKVGGTAALPAAAPMTLVLNPPPATADTKTVAAGEQLFGRYCAACHGENAVGGGVVPDLRASTFLGNDFFYEIVLNGAMKDAGMAPFKAVLEQKDAAAIRAYLIKRANEDKVSRAK